jgi:hypothetical protein
MTVLIVHSLFPSCSDNDAPEDGANAAPDTDKPAPAVETGDDWPFLVKVALVGIVVAVIAAWLRFSRGQSQAGVSYEKIRA